MAKPPTTNMLMSLTLPAVSSTTGGFAPFYIREVGNPQRWLMEPSTSTGATPYFYASTTPQSGMNRYYLSRAGSPSRTKLSTSPQCCGWTDQFSFYAYGSPQGAATRRISVQDYGRTSGTHRFRYHAGAPCCGWSEVFAFYAFSSPPGEPPYPLDPFLLLF